MYLGDFEPGQVLDFKFSTFDTSDAASTLGGSPAVKIYKGNSTSTESAAGVTLTPDFDGIVGLNHVRIDTSADASFYSAGGEYQAVLTAGTVAGVSWAGTSLHQWSLNRSAAALAAKYGVAALFIVEPWGSDSNNGLTHRTAFATIAAAVTAAHQVQGSGILIGAKRDEWDLGTTPINIFGPTAFGLGQGISLFGMGPWRTRLKYTGILGTHGPGIKWGNGSVIADLAIRAYPALTTSFGACAGWYSGISSFNIPLHVTIRNCLMWGQSDGIYISTVSANEMRLDIYDSIIGSDYDAVKVVTGSTGVTINAHRSRFVSRGPHADLDGNDYCRGISLERGTLNLWDCDIEANDADVETHAIETSASAACIARLFNCRLRSSSEEGAVLDIKAGSGSTVVADELTVYDSSKISGSVTAGDSSDRHERWKATDAGFDRVDSQSRVTSIGTSVDGETAASPASISADVWSSAHRTLTGPPAITGADQQTSLITIVRGNSYSEDSRNLVISLPDGPEDLSLWTWTFTAEVHPDNIDADGDTSFSGTVSVVTATGDTRGVRITITSAVTDSLSLGKFRGGLRGTLISDSTKKWTPDLPLIIVIDDPNQA